jgi:3-hexulose-6-phosphate synthase
MPSVEYVCENDLANERTNPMQLQLALDSPTALAIVPDVIEFVDIVEVGTPLLKRFGLGAILTVRELAAGRQVLADTKTVDGGAREAEMVFGAGASLMTVLYCASPATHEAIDRVAEAHDGRVVVDTICSPRLPDRSGALPDRSAYLSLHRPTDDRLAGVHSTAHVDAVASMRRLGYRVSLAGGIDSSNLAAVVAAGPDIVVVGSAITKAEDAGGVAKWMSAQLRT